MSKSALAAIADEAEQIMVAAMDAEARERFLVAIRQRAFAARQKAEARAGHKRRIRMQAIVAFIFLGFTLLLIFWLETTEHAQRDTTNTPCGRHLNPSNPCLHPFNP